MAKRVRKTRTLRRKTYKRKSAKRKNTMRRRKNTMRRKSIRNKKTNKRIKKNNKSIIKGGKGGKRPFARSHDEWYLRTFRQVCNMLNEGYNECVDTLVYSVDIDNIPVSSEGGFDSFDISDLADIADKC